MDNFYTKVKDYIRKDEINLALEDLLSYLKDKDARLLSEVTMHNAAFVENERNIRQGFIKMEESNLVKARIRSACLNIVNELEKEENDSLKTVNKKTNSTEKIPNLQDVKKILFLAANPTETTRLRLDEEISKVQQALDASRDSSKFILCSRWAVTATTLQQAILHEKPNIIHFSGHGDEEGIIIEDENGKPKLIDKDALCDLFSLFNDSLDCVLLNACFSEMQAVEIAKQVDYVIGMNNAIPDKTAINFAVGFYRGIASNKDIPFSYRLGVNLIKLEGLEGHEIPVLYKKNASNPQKRKKIIFTKISK